jgi:hypothetical protein
VQDTLPHSARPKTVVGVDLRQLRHGNAGTVGAPFSLGVQSRSGKERALMSDLFFLILTVAFVAISLLYVNACERL